MNEPRGMWPAVLPCNTAKSLADDPNWMRQKEVSDSIKLGQSQSGSWHDYRTTRRERKAEIIDLFMAGEATIEELADGFGLTVEHVETVIRRALK